MKYKKIASYKYKLVENASIYFPTGINIDHEYIKSGGGRLIIQAGYAWNGSDNPAIDTKNSMMASLFHDALCQLINLEIIDGSYRKRADRIYYDMCLESGMNKFRAWYQYQAIKFYQRNKKSFKRLENDYNKIYEVN
jgi:hypothetical protein